MIGTHGSVWIYATICLASSSHYSPNNRKRNLGLCLPSFHNGVGSVWYLILLRHEPAGLACFLSDLSTFGFYAAYSLDNDSSVRAVQSISEYISVRTSSTIISGTDERTPRLASACSRKADRQVPAWLPKSNNPIDASSVAMLGFFRSALMAVAAQRQPRL